MNRKQKLQIDWRQFNTGSNSVPIETFAKYGRIDGVRENLTHENLTIRRVNIEKMAPIEKHPINFHT